MTTDTQLRSLLRSLASLQSLDSDRQGVVIAPDRGGRGTPDADGKRVAQIDRGDVAKARVASERLTRCQSRAEFSWLVEVAHAAWSVDALALYVAKAHGPFEHRASLALHEAAEAEATKVLTDARQLAATLKAAHGALNAATLKAGAEALRVEARAVTAREHAATDRAALVAWGRVVIARCVREWEAT